MTTIVEAVDLERAQMFKRLVINEVAAHLALNPEDGDVATILNGIVNAACELITKVPSQYLRTKFAGQAARLLLYDTHTVSAEVLAEVERTKLAALLVDEKVGGHA
jgi:hypothetical protein